MSTLFWTWAASKFGGKVVGSNKIMKQTLPQGTSHLRWKFVDPGFQWLPGVLSQVQAGGQSDIAEPEYLGIDPWYGPLGHIQLSCYVSTVTLSPFWYFIVFLHTRIYGASAILKLEVIIIMIVSLGLASYSGQSEAEFELWDTAGCDYQLPAFKI